jgi:hypothetical protein
MGERRREGREGGREREGRERKGREGGREREGRERGTERKRQRPLPMMKKGF